MNLENKTAVVTGASSGLGKAFSTALVNKGTRVHGLARDEKKLTALQEEIGNHFQPLFLDVTDHTAIEKWVDETLAQNTPDILINNAGLGLFGSADQLSLEDWHQMVNTNLSGIFYMCRQIIPLMKENQGVSHIINIASIAGKVGTPQMSGYNATKFGVRGFSESLFKELRYDGIKVTCLCPGSTNTHFFDEAEGAETHDNMMKPNEVADILLNVLETPDNLLVNEVVMRPLNPKPPEEA